MLSRSNIASVPLLPITTFYIFGIVLHVYGLGLPSIIALPIISIVLYFYNTYFSTLALASVLGICQAYVFIPLEPDSNLIGKECVYSGTITQTSESESVQSLIIEVDSAGNAPFVLTPIKKTGIYVQYPDFTPEFQKGERLIFRSKLEKITARYDMPDEIDPAEFLVSRQIYLKSIITSDDIISIDKPSGVIGYICDIRNGIISQIKIADINSDAKELLIAMIAGDSTNITEDIWANFSNSGLSHILAISGLHVGIITFLISIALWPLYIIGRGNLRWACVIVMIWLFAVITGLSPSVTRSALMVTIYLISKLFRRNSPPLNSLCLAALLILMFNPQSLFEAGFQLSFAAVGAIIIFADKINPISPKHRIAYTAMSYVAVSVSAMMGTGIIAIMYFHNFPVYFLLSNILISIILPLFICGGIILITISFWQSEILLINHFVDLLSSLIINISELISEFPGSNIDNLYIPAYVIIPYILLLLSLKVMLDKPNKIRITITSGLLLITTVIIISNSTYRKPIESTVYLSRDLRHTELIVCNPKTGVTIVTNTPNEPFNVLDKAKSRLRDFMGKRRIDTLSIDTFNKRSDRMIVLGKKRIALISGKPMTFPAGKINYIIISKGYRDDMRDIIDSYNPDSIIISSDVHPQKALRYAGECIDYKQPYVLARDRAWSFSYPSSLYPIIK